MSTCSLQSPQTNTAEVTRQFRNFCDIMSQKRGMVFYPHTRAILGKLLDVACGRTKRLLILMPPRHGATTLVGNLLPAFCATHLGDYRHIGLGTYYTMGTQYLCESAENLTWLTAETQPAELVPASTHSALTGRGLDLVILDSLVKNIDTWKQRENELLDWYQQTLTPHLQPDAPQVIVGWRCGPNDFYERLIEDGVSQGERWDVLSLPAIATADSALRKIGESLWPEVFSVERLQEIRASIGNNAWHWMYQQGL